MRSLGCNNGAFIAMGLLPDTYNCELRMRRECWERYPRDRLQRKPLVSDPGMHHCVTHVPRYMSASLTRTARKTDVPVIPGACATKNFTYLAIGPFSQVALEVITGCTESKVWSPRIIDHLITCSDLSSRWVTLMVAVQWPPGCPVVGVTLC